VVPLADGVRIIGRDYVATIGGTSTAYNGWTFQSGIGMSPIALNASGLRGFFQTYQKFKWNKANAHYITSSPTSLSGDILLVYHANHGGPKVDHSSSNFLSYALSTDSALIGPQWTNHSVALIEGKHEWFDTDVLNSEDVQHQADGELLVYTKNTTNGSAPDSPGYLLVDYDISFQGRMLNPRILTLPSALFKWFPTGCFTPATYTAADQVTAQFTSTNSYSGVAIGLPSGTTNGDVFQIVLDTTAIGNSGGLPLATAWSYALNYTGTGATSAPLLASYPITNGMTIYAATAGTSAVFFPSYTAAMSGNPLRWTSSSAAGQLTFPVTMCCVGSSSAVFLQASIG
jgi:hypothetical protein